MPYMLAVGDFHLKKVYKCIIHKVSLIDFSKEEKAVCKMWFEMNSNLQICEGLKTRNAFYLYMHTTGFFLKTHAASVQNSLMFYIYQLTKVHVIPNTDCVQSFVSRNISMKLDRVTCTCIERNIVFIGKKTALFCFSFLVSAYRTWIWC